MRRNRPEEALQRTVAEYLDLALPKDAVWFHVPNGGGRSKAEAGAFKAMGVKAGVPDVYILHEGKSLFIELKPPRRYLSKDQKEMGARLVNAGAVFAVCRSLESVIAECEFYFPKIVWADAQEGPTVKVQAGG